MRRADDGARPARTKPSARSSRPRPKPGSQETTATLASDAVTGTDPIGMPSIGRAVRDLGAAFTQVGAVTREGTELAAELLKIARGSSSVTPEPRDWRFQGPARSRKPLYPRGAPSDFSGGGWAGGGPPAVSPPAH